MEGELACQLSTFTQQNKFSFTESSYNKNKIGETAVLLRQQKQQADTFLINVGWDNCVQNQGYVLGKEPR